jgi:repressor LexA
MAKNERRQMSAGGSLASRSPYTAKQGQYLAFIHAYQKVHRRAPAETDLQQYFQVSPPSVHDMILRLEEQGLIARVSGQARSIRILLPPEQLPELES